MIAQLSKNLLTLEEQTQLVQGSVGETVKLKRSDDWKRMTATAVFSNGELTRDVIVSGETLLIPWELLQEEGRRLTLNFHGADDSGGVVQTNIASLGRVKKSNSPSGIPPEAPTPARADQIQSSISYSFLCIGYIRQIVRNRFCFIRYFQLSCSPVCYIIDGLQFEAQVSCCH